ncbi:P2Y purinoceptor 14-like [Scomber japonicus]|uniref:P2Y purinoceptor 14-like n=1 Tax=Scomber japonicus TaxID=13676 RepID=UPI00230558AC|nr:P2Y purinoceptor 14-like [Scomber japonicus]
METVRPLLVSQGSDSEYGLTAADITVGKQAYSDWLEIKVWVTLQAKPPETKMDVTSSSNQSSANTQSQVNSQCEHIDKSGHLFFALAYSLVFVVGLVLNGFTLKVYFCTAQRQVSNIMMVYLKNLAASDFLLCLCLPSYIANYISSSVTLRLVHCIFASCAFYLNMYASILFMGYIAADRYFKIIHPLRTHILRTVKAARIISTVTWVFFLALMTSYITLWHLTKPELTFVPDKCDTLESPQVIVFYKIIHVGSATTFLFVLVCMIFFYYSASRSLLQAQQRQLASSSCKKLMRSNRKMLVLVSVFCVCFVPYHLTLIPYALLRKYCSLRLMLHYLIEGTILLSVFNVCLDPVIYFFSCKAFRTNLNLERVFTRNKQTPRTETRRNEGQLSIIHTN